MDTKEFEQTIIDGMTAVDTRIKSFEQYQTETKKILGELQAEIKEVNRLKDAVNGVSEIATKIQRAQLAIQAEAHTGRRDGVRALCEQPGVADAIIGRCKEAARLTLTPAQRTAITGVDSGIGAALAPQATGQAVYDNLLRYGQWSTLGVVPIGARTTVMPLITVRPTAYWIADGAQITEGAVTGTSTTVTIQNCAAWIPIGNGVLEDAQDNDVDLAAYILDLLAQGIAYRLDWACFAADGTADSTDGSYTGIAVGGTAATAADGNTTVAALQLDDFVRCLTSVNAGVLQRPARWWIHPTTIAKLALIKDANNRPIFQNANDAPAPMGVGSILGFPVTSAGAMPSTDSAGKVVAVYGDPKGCAVGVRKSLNLASSSEFQFDYLRTAFRGHMRAGVQVQLATSFAMLTTAAA